LRRWLRALTAAALPPRARRRDLTEHGFVDAHFDGLSQPAQERSASRGLALGDDASANCVVHLDQRALARLDL
jgi:hypothetical protein